jgi:hypothetical protein
MDEEETQSTEGLISREEQTMDEDPTNPTAVDPTEAAGNQLVQYVQDQFRKAEDGRRQDEERWLKAYKNYRGIYDSSVQFTSTEKSRAFIKITKTKVLAAYGQIVEVLFGGGKFPIGIAPTPVPEGIAESVHFSIKPSQPEAQKPEEDPTLKPGETTSELMDRLGSMKEKLKPIEEDVKEGPGSGPDQITVHPAALDGAKMEKRIHDQLVESDGNKQLRLSAFEMPLFGTGVVKGPFSVTKEYARWTEEGKYDPVEKTIPQISHVSIWNSYPDPEALNMAEAEYFVERHKLSRTGLNALKSRPLFKKEAIQKAIALGPDYQYKWWETEMQDDETHTSNERYEGLEFWGYVPRETLEGFGIKTTGFKDEDMISANIWVVNGEVIRCVLNPYTPTTIPYHAAPYELNPYSFFGVGVAENMEDTQLLMNGFMRMAIDNAALSGNLIIEVDETYLVQGQSMDVYPGKVFRRNGGAPGQSIFGTKYPNVSNENMQMFDVSRRLADEATGIPSFSHGQTGVSGVGRTSSGISMLMSAANGSVRTVVKNLDDYLLAPIGKALYRFNMQFLFDEHKISGDLEVKATGTESLMANEVRSQRLMQFLSLVQNPVLAPFAKMDYIIQEIAKSMDLDPDKVVNNLADAAIMAKIMQAMAPPEQQAPPGAPQGAGGPPAVSDPTGSGDGNIGAGSSPQVGQEGFTGNVS